MADQQPQAVVNSKEIIAKLTPALEALNQLTPVANKAQQAFGGLENLQSRIMDLKNKVNTAIATYKSP